MKKGLTIILFLALQMITYDVQGQDAFLESINEVVITPEDVNVHYKEQIGHYTKKYQALITDLTNTRTSYQLEIEQIESKKKIRRKDAKHISGLKTLMAILREDIKVLKACISVWADLKIHDNERFEHLFSNRCYNVITKEDVYSPERYIMLTTFKDEQITWYELAEGAEREEEETIVTEKATTKWVRRKADRNCASQDPNDCLVWCLVEVPATTQTIIKNIQECPIGFQYETNDICVREVSIDNENKTTERLRLISTSNFMEIHPVSFEESDCE